jgi:hypothetical protein
MSAPHFIWEAVASEMATLKKSSISKSRHTLSSESSPKSSNGVSSENSATVVRGRRADILPLIIWINSVGMDFIWSTIQRPFCQASSFPNLSFLTSFFRDLTDGPATQGLDAWKPGRYKVEIHVGEQINEMSLMGTMRFTILADER